MQHTVRLRHVDAAGSGDLSLIYDQAPATMAGIRANSDLTI